MSWQPRNLPVFAPVKEEYVDAPLRITSYNVCYTKLLRGILLIHVTQEIEHTFGNLRP